MALETATYISQLVATNPPGSDLLAQADDHIRLIKSTEQATFAGFTGAVIVTGTDTGAANAYVLTPATALPSYVSGMLCIFTPTNVNTGASTVNISGLGAKSIKNPTGAVLAAGDLPVSYPSLLQYDGTNFVLIGGAGLALKTYVDSLAFSTALPAQATHADQLVTTNGTTGSWTNDLKSTLRLVDSADTTKKLALGLSGLTTATTRTATFPDKDGTVAMLSDFPTLGWTRLSTVTAAAASTMDFDTTFDATYDSYVIQIPVLALSGVGAALDFRLKIGGAYLTTANYYSHSANPDSTAATYFATARAAQTTGRIYVGFDANAASSINLTIWVNNPTSTTKAKLIYWQGVNTQVSGPNVTLIAGSGGFIGTNTALTGVRLMPDAGTITGTGRLYGIKNT